VQSADPGRLTTTFRGKSGNQRDNDILMLFDSGPLPRLICRIRICHISNRRGPNGELFAKRPAPVAGLYSFAGLSSSSLPFAPPGQLRAADRARCGQRRSRSSHGRAPWPSVTTRYAISCSAAPRWISVSRRSCVERHKMGSGAISVKHRG
jgi:hypothetical protein